MNITYFRQRKLGPETELEDAIVKWIPHYFSNYEHQLWTGGSVPIGAGLPDIIAATYKPELTCLAETNAHIIQVLAYLRSVGRARLDTISNRIGLSQELIAECLDDLVQVQVVRSKSNSFTISPIWRKILPTIVSIEAKVTNWRRAIIQARRNLIFSNKSLVALPKNTAQRVKSHPVFQQFGIGLLAVNNKNEVRVLRRGRSAEPSVWGYYYLLASYIAMNCEENINAI